MTSAAISVDPLWFDVPGGVGTYVRNLVPRMLERDPTLELTLFHSRFDRPAPDEPWAHGLHVETLPRSIRTLYPLWNVAGRPALPRSLGGADVLHATTGVAVPPTTPGQRLVVTIHDLAFVRFPELFPRRWRILYRLGLRAAARRADAILVPSRSTADDLIARTRLDPERVRVTPLAATLGVGPEDPDAALLRLGVPRPYLLFVGTLEPRKNLVRLVRAYRRAAAGGIPQALVLAGPIGWGSDPLERELELAGDGTVVRTGRVTEPDLDALYRGASAFLYPSLYEGFGLPVLEAMARGVPVVASNTSSLPEVVGDAGILVDPRSVEELAGAIVEVLADQVVARLADAGRSRASRFSWDETARLTIEAYRPQN